MSLDNRSIELNNKVNKNGWKRYSEKNLDLLIKTLDTLLESDNRNEHAPVLRISKNSFSKIGIESIDALGFLNNLQKGYKLFEVINVLYENALRESDTEERDVQLSTIQDLGFSTKDLEANFILDIENPYEITHQLRKVRKQIEEWKDDKYKQASHNDALNLPYPEFKKWDSHEEEHWGEYIISDQIHVKFKSGRFGGINELMKNKGHEVTRVQLISAIKKHSQGKSDNVSITKWKYELRRDTDFDKYFYLHYMKPHFYILYLK